MGFDVAEALKRLRIPFVLMSGVHKGARPTRRSLEVTAAAGLLSEKPFERSALLAAVRKQVPVSSPGGRASPSTSSRDPQVAEAAEANAAHGAHRPA